MPQRYESFPDITFGAATEKGRRRSKIGINMSMEPLRSLVFAVLGAFVGSCEIAVSKRLGAFCLPLQPTLRSAPFRTGGFKSPACWNGVQASIGVCRRLNNFRPVIHSQRRREGAEFRNFHSSSSRFLGLPTFSLKPQSLANERQYLRKTHWTCLNQFYDDDRDDQVCALFMSSHAGTDHNV